MTKTGLCFLLFFFLHQNINAQTGTDALALNMPQASTYNLAQMANYIKQNFTTDSARIRAIYVWVTNNIKYDLTRVPVRNNISNTAPQAVADVLKTRSAVCQGYAELFAELCHNLGIKAYVIGGYTKKEGAVNNLPHAWVSVQMDGNWYLFDPTWGAGYVQNNQFVHAPNNRFYKLAPAEMIKDHMPFDPMYQFLNHPITNKEFIEGQTSINTGKPLFNYADTLQHFAQLSTDEKLKSEARRLEANGIRNDLLLQRLNFLKMGNGPFAFNQANELLKQTVDLFNQYINYRNKQFVNLEDAALQQMVDSIANYSNQARAQLQQVTPADAAQRQMLSNTYQNLEKIQLRVVKEKEFVAKYLATDKAARKQLFSGY